MLQLYGRENTVFYKHEEQFLRLQSICVLRIETTVLTVAIDHNGPTHPLPPQICQPLGSGATGLSGLAQHWEFHTYIRHDQQWADPITPRCAISDPEIR